MLVKHEEQNTFWSLAPFVAVKEERSIHQTNTFLDNSPISVFGASDVVRTFETEMQAAGRVRLWLSAAQQFLKRVELGQITRSLCNLWDPRLGKTPAPTKECQRSILT